MSFLPVSSSSIIEVISTVCVLDNYGRRTSRVASSIEIVMSYRTYALTLILLTLCVVEDDNLYPRSIVMTMFVSNNCFGSSI